MPDFRWQDEKFRMSLYQLDWSDCDLEVQQLMHLMLVSSTPQRTIKVGRTIEIKLESFTTVRNYGELKNCIFSFSLLHSLSKSASLIALYC